jgi:hypothetical protein
MTAFPCFAPSGPQRRIFTRHDAVHIDKLAVKSVLRRRGRTHMGDVFPLKGLSPMTKLIPTIAAALLATAVATPVFAQAAIQEPGLYSFYHPNADVLAGRSAYRAPVDANAYYNVATPAPQVRHHRAVRGTR